jgi:hypothetical protein
LRARLRERTHLEATEKNIETGNFPPLSGEKPLGREISYKETSLKDDSIARIDQDCSGMDSREKTAPRSGALMKGDDSFFALKSREIIR